MWEYTAEAEGALPPVHRKHNLASASCVDAKTGERVWQKRIGGQFSASPVAGDGKIYLVSETGDTVVLRAGREFDVIARNNIGEHTIASPAISNGQIFLRTDEHLIAIGQ